MEIDGLTYTPDAITAAQEAKLMNFILNSDRDQWHNAAGGRLVKQYGVHYNYNERRVMRAQRGEIPQVLTDLTEELKLPRPDNVIINRYLPGEGIAAEGLGRRPQHTLTIMNSVKLLQPKA